MKFGGGYRMVKVSVIVIVYNEIESICDCITSILNQSFTNFELIVIDDFSYHKTYEILTSFKDKRLKIVRNTKNEGITKSRNIGLNSSIGEFIFFTDGDCIPRRNWLEEGLKTFQNENCVGVEGKTYYSVIQPTMSDRVTENLRGKEYRTCNIAYKKKIIKEVSCFDARYKNAYEDLDLALRIKRKGKITFNKYMVVGHQQKKWSVKQLFDAKRVKDEILLIKRYNYGKNMIWKILHPIDLLVLLFPFLILGSFIVNRYKTKEDFKLFPVIYVKSIYLRLLIWKTAFKEKIFLI